MKTVLDAALENVKKIRETLKNWPKIDRKTLSSIKTEIKLVKNEENDLEQFYSVVEKIMTENQHKNNLENENENLKKLTMQKNMTTSNNSPEAEIINKITHIKEKFLKDKGILLEDLEQIKIEKNDLNKLKDDLYKTETFCNDLEELVKEMFLIDGEKSFPSETFNRILKYFN